MRLIDEESHWLLEKVPFRQVNVFGENSIALNEKFPTRTGPISNFLKPSRGVFGSLGIDHFRCRTNRIIFIFARFFLRFPLSF